MDYSGQQANMFTEPFFFFFGIHLEGEESVENLHSTQRKYTLTIVICLPQLACSYETACEEYIKALKVIQASEDDKKSSPLQKSIQAPVMEFIVNRVRKQ